MNVSDRGHLGPLLASEKNREGFLSGDSGVVGKALAVEYAREGSFRVALSVSRRHLSVRYFDDMGISLRLGRLVPTARVDKNGRVVTRHMKDGSEGSGEARKSFPVVPPTPQSNKKELIEQAIATVSWTVRDGDVPSGPIEEHLTAHLSTFSIQTLDRIRNATQPYHRTSLFRVNAELIMDEVDESYINDLIQLAKFMNDNGFDSERTGNLLIGARQVNGLAPQGKDGSYPEERLEQIAALMSATDAISQATVDGKLKGMSHIDFSAGYGSPVIADVELQRLILEAPEDERTRIINIMKERSIFDVETIADLLTHDGSLALGSGKL